MIRSINPASGEALAEFPEIESTQIDHRLARAGRAQRNWSATDMPTRTRALTAIADGLVAQRDYLARLISLEMGKPITEAIGEIEKCAWNFRFYAEAAPAMLAVLIFIES